LHHTLPLSIPILSIIDQPYHVNEAKKLVEVALDDLVSTGALQSLNQMSINALLNPTDELNMLDDVTKEEIYDAVMGSRMLSKSGDDIMLRSVTMPPKNFFLLSSLAPTRSSHYPFLYSIHKLQPHLDLG
jgi:hypothetical protein